MGAKEEAGKSFLGLVVVVIIAICFAFLIQAFLVKPYQIPSESMEPTLTVGQRILVNRFVYNFTEPSPGDVVVFHPPVGAGDGVAGGCGEYHGADESCPRSGDVRSKETFVKRIVAGPGDTVSVQGGLPVVNGKTLEPRGYEITPCSPEGIGCDLPKEIVIPPNHYFLMGDNRGESADSRFWGPLPEEWLIGKAFATYWPPKRISSL